VPTAGPSHDGGLGGYSSTAAERVIADLRYHRRSKSGLFVVSHAHVRPLPAFLRIVANLVSKDISIDRKLNAGPLSDFTDEELEALLYAAQNAVAKAESTSASVPQRSDQRLLG